MKTKINLYYNYSLLINTLFNWYYQHGVIFFKFLARMGGGAKNCPKKYNIDYFGYAVNLEFKFKLNFDQEGGSKI